MFSSVRSPKLLWRRLPWPVSPASFAGEEVGFGKDRPCDVEDGIFPIALNSFVDARGGCRVAVMDRSVRTTASKQGLLTRVRRRNRQKERVRIPYDER